MQLDLTQILLWILEALAGIFMTYIFPKVVELINEKIDTHKLEKVLQDIDKFADAAEQLAKKAQLDGDWKNQYVLNLLSVNGYTVDETLKAYVEAKVKHINDANKNFQSARVHGLQQQMCTRAFISVAFPMRFAQLCELFLLCVINAATGFSHFFSTNHPVNLCLLDVRTRILGLNLPTTVLLYLYVISVAQPSEQHKVSLSF